MAARKKQAVDSTKRVVKKAPVKKKDAKPKDTAATDGAQQVGHNSRVPTAAEMRGYMTRLDALHTQKNEANAKFMSDIKAVYEEASNKFGSSRKLMRRLYAKKKAEEAFAEEISELEQKEKDDLDRLILGAAKAFGDETPFGAFLAAQVKAGELSAAKFDEIAPPETKPVKTIAQAAAEAIEADEREIHQEQQRH